MSQGAEDDDPAVRSGGGEDIRDRAVVGVFWAAAQKWLVRLSTLVAFILLGRLLTPQEFGVVALAMTFIAVLATVSDAGLTPWIVQRRGLTREATSTAFWLSASLGVLLAGLLAAISVPVARWLDSPELATILPVLAATLVVTGMSAVPAALLQRQLRFKELAVRQVVATLLSVVVAVVLALAGAGVWALVAQTVVRVVVAAVVLWATSDFRPRFVVSGPDARDMTSYGTKSLGVTLGGTFNDQGEPFVIGAMLGTTALGYWTIAGRLVTVINELCSAAIGSVAGPVFSELQDQPERLARTFTRIIGAGAFLLVPAMTAMSLASHDLVPLVFGSQWEQSAVVASILAASMLFQGLNGLQRGLLIGTGRAGPELALTVVTVAGQLALVVLLSGGGLTAVAAGLSVWSLCMFVARGTVVARQLGVGVSAYRSVLTVLLAAGVSAAAVVVTLRWVPSDPLVTLLVVAVVGGLVFAGACLVVARPTVRDIRTVVTETLARRRGRRRPAADPVPATEAPDPVSRANGP